MCLYCNERFISNKTPPIKARLETDPARLPAARIDQILNVDTITKQRALC